MEAQRQMETYTFGPEQIRQLMIADVIKALAKNWRKVIEGAFSVICDVGEYRKCVKEFKIPLLNTLFDTLHALCNLLLALPKDLNQYFNREELMSLDPSIRLNFIQLRTDFKTARQKINLK
ncbi:unnamed protein product [Allacma fusca]|uniref:Exocyst complex component Sec10-like alpha-helical bundle domain-containing protein n=1 Tax=Allacma fusca TaxID=39272 RepID=A0A8J2LIE1_9HEXA|nr:unnamed protein product [Allacma fusca]